MGKGPQSLSCTSHIASQGPTRRSNSPSSGGSSVGRSAHEQDVAPMRVSPAHTTANLVTFVNLRCACPRRQAYSFTGFTGASSFRSRAGGDGARRMSCRDQGLATNRWGTASPLVCGSSFRVVFRRMGAGGGLPRQDGTRACKSAKMSTICSRLARRSVAISSASTCGSGRFAESSRLSSRSQKMSRLALSRAMISS